MCSASGSHPSKAVRRRRAAVFFAVDFSAEVFLAGCFFGVVFLAAVFVLGISCTSAEPAPRAACALATDSLRAVIRSGDEARLGGCREAPSPSPAAVGPALICVRKEFGKDAHS